MGEFAGKRNSGADSGIVRKSRHKWGTCLILLCFSRLNAFNRVLM
ncbi:hypothetical protein B4099_0576 [Heyndrickxia coagulans]|uniref:Uncharacterized protein n=1 Tax=Heyndrickxia coagulans TaxID=1398 RepID=A0A150KJV1_HEYCO|nr:hypothetical protein B4099_0576 [Heyndrickxia coagulans]